MSAKWLNFDLDFCDLCGRVYFICDLCGDNSCGMRGCTICRTYWPLFETTKWYNIILRENFENEVFNTK